MLFVLQEDVEAALACTDVTQLDVSSIISVNDDPQQALKLRIKRQTKFLRECRDIKASVSFLCLLSILIKFAVTHDGVGLGVVLGLTFH